VANLKFATRLDHELSELQIRKSTLESIFSSVAYDSKIRRFFYYLALHRCLANFGIATLGLQQGYLSERRKRLRPSVAPFPVYNAHRTRAEESTAGRRGIMAKPASAKTLGTALVAVAALGFGLTFSAGVARAQKQGGSITVGLELDIAGFDPLKVGVYDTAANMAASLIFDTLTYLDDNGKAQPKIATEWQASEDFRKWTFKLRPGVKFHDGTPFNAQALKANFDRQKDPKNKCRCAIYITNWLSLDVVDDLTVTYTLKDPSTMLPELLSIPSSNNAIHSPAAWEAKGDDYNRNPIGTGPFIMKSWTAGDRLVLEKNPNYWDKGKPYLDRVVMRPLPDQQARFASLMAGESDIIWDDAFDYDNIKKAKTDKNLTVHEYTGSGSGVYAMNTKVPPLDDVRVRQALVMAIDKPKFSQVVSGGLFKAATNPYGEGSWVKCKDDGALPYDPTKAKALLQEYGKPVKFKTIVTATPRGRTNGQVLQQFWKQIGAEMEIDQVDQAAIVARAFQRQFDITPWRIIDLADPDIQMYANFHTGSSSALANYSNPELDALLQRARSTPDRDKRAEDYCAIARIINKEAIWFWTFQNTYYAIGKAKVKGIPKMYNSVIDVSKAWLE
jgi:peptide/nickel transport system substrate-binding protein